MVYEYRSLRRKGGGQGGVPSADPRSIAIVRNSTSMEVSSVKKLIALPVALVFALGTADFAVAQEKKPDTMKSDTMKSDTKMEKKAEKKAASKTANGTVKSASADSVVVAGKDKGKEAEWTFAVDPKTTIKKGGKAITAADVKT